MPATEERVDRLENLVMELAEAQIRTQASVKALSDEMREFKGEMAAFKREMLAFKDEMRDFKDEMLVFKDEMTMFKDEMTAFKEEARAERREMNRKWGELANKWGAVVEDIVAPNIPRIARENFGWDDIEDFMIRRKVRNKRDTSKLREFDVIAVRANQVIINEPKSTPRFDYINEFIRALEEVEDYFPEYRGKTIIPIFASLSISEDVVNYLTRNKIYAMAMGDETMDIKNFHEVSELRAAQR